MSEPPDRNRSADTAGSPPRSIRVHAPARLHFGFLDLHGGLGRRFGSLGLAIDAPGVRLTATASDILAVEGPEAGRVRGYVRAAADHLGVPATVAIRVEAAIPAHAGFGSGTQLALSVAAALAGLATKPFSAEGFSNALDRGNRSGIGLRAFTEGGLIVDAGRDATGAPPPVIARLPYPEAWRVVLILDETATGLHGISERAAFRDLPRFPEAQAAEICRIVLMQVMPALVLAEPRGFGAGISAIQRLIGDHFSPHQGGRYASPAVAEALAWVAAQGVAGYGQSSWGPTGFALVPSDADARALVDGLTRPGPLRFLIARGRNRGADMSVA
ncbi:beta-ribofuranosylaminobenzene 5'-phosphate synthase family protein [uncultured Methylobacterium sp.]|uniref:beta-ribofuranosylaminobenzene 5'-phosphate synthase family protein n=1 Tax=uncultured Methylobacterium sp. TaxID=157278 RepID=UPI0035C95161